MDDFQVLRAKLASIHFDKPNDVLPKDIADRANTLMPPKENDDVIQQLTVQTTNYVDNIKTTNIVVAKLMKIIDELKEELQTEKQLNKDLHNQLDAYSQTAAANITKRMFSYYVEASLDRKATADDWKKFVNYFDYDNSDLDKKIYTWITTNLRK